MKHLFLLALALVGGGKSLCGSEAVWQAVTDRGEVIALEAVDYLVADDGADNFSIVLTDGGAVEGVKSLGFEMLVATGLPVGVALDKATVLFEDGGAGGSVTVTGVAPLGTVSVLSLDGRVIVSSDAKGRDKVTVDVSALSPGYYLLSAGSTVIKFYKK